MGPSVLLAMGPTVLLAGPHSSPTSLFRRVISAIRRCSITDSGSPPPVPDRAGGAAAIAGAGCAPYEPGGAPKALLGRELELNSGLPRGTPIEGLGDPRGTPPPPPPPEGGAKLRIAS